MTGLWFVEKDLDGDGRIDEIAWFDQKGDIAKLAIDSSHDGTMDRIHHPDCQGSGTYAKETAAKGDIEKWNINRYNKIIPLQRPLR